MLNVTADIPWDGGTIVPSLVQNRQALLAVVFNGCCAPAERDSLVRDIRGSDVMIMEGDPPWHMSTLHMREYLLSLTTTGKSTSFDGFYGKLRATPWHDPADPSRYFSLLGTHRCLWGVMHCYSNADDPFFETNWKTWDGRQVVERQLFRDVYPCLA